ncbi:MAG: hypothetical protein JO022_00410, partial [Acidobacteriaceae bacterium]|nr:hypothetical protein [Acidobacteriaceae bacterium]
SASLQIDPWSINASAQLSAFINGLNLNLAGLLPYIPMNFSANLAAVIQLNAVLSLIASFRAALNIDLLGPMAFLQLQALLSMGIPGIAASLTASASATASISAQFSAAAQLVGGFPNLAIAIQLLAQLCLGLPVIAGPNLMLLLQLSMLLNLSANLDAVLGLSATAQANIQLALQPLWLLASLSAQLQLDVPVPAMSLSATATATATATADVSASASLFANLTIPSLGSLALAATFAAQGGLLNLTPCSFGCPMQALANAVG